MFKYFYITIAVFFLNCKDNNIGQNKISTNSSSNTSKAVESNTSVDSILNWKSNYDYDGYPDGILSNNGKYFTYVNYWFYSDFEIVKIVIL